MTIPIPTKEELAETTKTVAENNQFSVNPPDSDRILMGTLRYKIKHVIYIVKENRTYDQVSEIWIAGMAIVRLPSSAPPLPQISIIWLNNLSVWITSMIPETSVPTAGPGVRRAVKATLVLKQLFSSMRGEV